MLSVSGKPRRLRQGYVGAWHDGAFTIDDPRIQPCPTTGCWLWSIASVGSYGYGRAKVYGKNVPAHRAFYENARGPIPAGMVLDHICRVTACVNPDHLRPVTKAQNNTENSMSPPALNKQKEKCPKCGGAYHVRQHKTHGYAFRACRKCQADNNRESRRIRMAHLLECERRVPELEAEVAALRAENARLASAGRRILGAWDALDAIPPDDPRPTHEFADAFAATLEPMRDALSAARPIDPQRGPTDE